MIQNAIYLIQTDTTVGFVSQNPFYLARAKKRNPSQPFLLCVDSLKKQKKLTRTPKFFRKKLRRAQKLTPLYPNKKAIRVVKEYHHKKFLKRFDYVYSTSANESNKKFDLKYAVNHADIIVEDKRGFHESLASRILQLGKNKIYKVR